MYLKHVIAAFAMPLLSASSAGAAPRLSQILPQTQIPDRPPVVVDLFDSGRPDILFNSRPSLGTLQENALFIRNLGNRIFGQPHFTHFRSSSGGMADEITYLVTPGSFTGKALFFNEVTGSEPGAVSMPTVVALDALGRIQHRMALAPSMGGRWIAVDLDGDDVTAFLEERANDDGVSELLIHDRQPDGTYATTIVPIDLPLYLAKAAAIDLDADGDRDLVITYEIGNPGMNIVERTGSRNFSPTTTFISGASPDSTFADLDGDGLPDILSDGGDPFEYTLNLGGLGFAPSGSVQVAPGYILVKPDPRPQEPAVLSFAGTTDGASTVRTIRFGTWETIATRTPETSLLDRNSTSLEILALEDLDSDGNDDALIISTTSLLRRGLNLNARRLSVAWGNGSGFAPAEYIHPAPISTHMHVSGEFEGHPGDDLIMGPDTDGNFALLQNTGEGTFPLIRMIPEINAPASAPDGTLVSALHAGDIDGDGKTDLAISYEKSVSGEGYRSACGIAKGNGDGTFQPPILPVRAFDIVTRSPCGIDQLLDWDGDGDLDAVGSGAWRENLGGKFDANFRPLIGGVTTTDIFGNTVDLIRTCAGDLDGDGSPDIVSLVYDVDLAFPSVAGTGGGVSKSTMAVAFNDGIGGVASIADFEGNLAATDVFGNPVLGRAFIADMNADGLPDLVTAELGLTDIYGNTIPRNFWRRNPGGGSRDPGSWVKLALADNGSLGGPLLDFNGDGIREYVSTTGFTRPDRLGPLISPLYNLISPVGLPFTETILSGDFDKDDDADFILKAGDLDLLLLENPSVDGRNPITRNLLEKGVRGALAGPDSDADGDGRSNFAEIFFSSDPVVPDRVEVDPFHMRVSRDTTDDVLSFTTPAYAWPDNAVTAGYEVSVDLRDWKPVSNAETVRAIRLGSNVFHTVSVPHAGSPAAFYRLKGLHITDP